MDTEPGNHQGATVLWTQACATYAQRTDIPPLTTQNWEAACAQAKHDGASPQQTTAELMDSLGISGPW